MTIGPAYHNVLIMSWDIITSAIEGRLLSSAFLLMVCIIIGMFSFYFFTRNVSSSTRRHNIKSRVVYILIFIYFILFLKIWVSGLSHLFTMLSLIGAGLVVANKETVMNFIGALIINWRNLFSEGDRIVLMNHYGYVKKIGILYVTLNESCKYSLNRATGKIIRIPNGLVITNPVINLSQNLNILEADISLVVDLDNDIDMIENLMLDCVKNELKEYFKDRPEYSDNYILKRNLFAKKLLEQEPITVITMLLDEQAAVEIKICYYSYSKDQLPIKNHLNKAIIQLVRKNAIKLRQENRN